MTRKNTSQSTNPFAENPTDLDNARHDEQRAVMAQINEVGESPFLLKNMRAMASQPILKIGKHWYITTNRWPYDHTALHLLIIHQQDIHDLTQLAPEASQELVELAAWICREFKVSGGGFCMRFGDSNYSAGTVAHLHAQFIVPDLADSEYASVRFKIGKRPEQIPDNARQKNLRDSYLKKIAELSAVNQS